MIFNIMQENRGPAPSRNAAARMSSGIFLAFVDSDCRVDPHWLENALNAFTEPAIGFVTGSIRHKPEQPVAFFTRSHDPVTVETPCYPTMNIMYRRSVFFELGGFEESLCFNDFRGRVVECSDCDLAWRVKEAGYRNVFVPEMLVYHEREKQTALNWLLEPVYLFAVPLLVRRHPQMRGRLLRWHWFLNALHPPYYFLIAAVILAIATRRWGFLVLAVPYLMIVARACRRRWAPGPLDLFAWVALIGARQAVGTAALIYGSARFRRLVL